jgi:DNA-directed RNA polymerase specialized sigma24 family protein
MARESRSDDRFLISPVDRRGRAIDPGVLDVAKEIGPRAIAHGERVVGDPAVAATLLEESAAAVSRALRMKQQIGEPPVHDLEAYLFRAFIRRVNKARTRQVVITDSVSAHPRDSSTQDNFEWRVLIDEFLTRCDPVTRDMFYRRIQGFSWKEIGIVYGISSHAAESRFGQALQRVRKRLRLQK